MVPNTARRPGASWPGPPFCLGFLEISPIGPTFAPLSQHNISGSSRVESRANIRLIVCELIVHCKLMGTLSSRFCLEDEKLSVHII